MTALERLVESFFANDAPDRVGRFPFRNQHFPERHAMQPVVAERLSVDFPFSRSLRAVSRSKQGNAGDVSHPVKRKNGKTGKDDLSVCIDKASYFPLATCPPRTPGNGWVWPRNVRPHSAVDTAIQAGSVARCCACGHVEGGDRFLAVMHAPTATWSQMHSACYLEIAGATRL